MSYPKIRWLITTGGVGTDDNWLRTFSTHGIGKHHLRLWIREMANRTGKMAWAETWPEDTAYKELGDKCRYYKTYPAQQKEETQ